MVFCKPDALRGQRSRVPAGRAGAFLRALAAGCGGAAEVPAEWAAAAGRAARQVAERAVTEPAFQGTILDAAGAARRLETAAARLAGGAVATPHALRAAAEGLGFEVEASARLVLGEAGVDAVYAGTVTTAEFAVIRPDLIGYLARDEIEVWRLSGGQAGCALQWWKTYARQMLVDREPGVHLLRNLVHACDGPDAGYLSGRLWR